MQIIYRYLYLPLIFIIISFIINYSSHEFTYTCTMGMLYNGMRCPFFQPCKPVRRHFLRTAWQQGRTTVRVQRRQSGCSSAAVPAQRLQRNSKSLADGSHGIGCWYGGGCGGGGGGVGVGCMCRDVGVSVGVGWARVFAACVGMWVRAGV